MRKLIHVEGHSTPRGAYSHAVRVEAGGVAHLYVTGQLALDAAGAVVAPHDPAAQTEFIFRLIDEILRAADMDLSHIVRVQTYLTSMADFVHYRPVRDRWLGAHRPPSTLIEVKGLAQPACCVEIEVTALKEIA